MKTQKPPFQLSFSAALKVDFQGSRVTSDGGLILVRELDERLGLEDELPQVPVGGIGGGITSPIGR